MEGEGDTHYISVGSDVPIRGLLFSESVCNGWGGGRG